MKSMVKQYGTKRGEQVFYASKNKGTIEGVEENKKMSYLDKILRNLQENEAVKAADAAAEKRKKEAEDRNRRFKEAEKKGEEADRKASAAAASLSQKESLVYAFNRWATHLAEAGRELGGIAKPYEGKKTSDIKDPRVRSAAEQQKAKVDKKLGVKTNPDAGQLVQQSQEQKKKRREGGAAGTPTEPSDIAKADAAEDKKKLAGDK